MSLQTQVGLYYSAGVAGDRASHNPVVYLPENPLAEGAVTVGNFVFYGTDPQTQVKSSGSVIAGFVERLINYYNLNLLSGATMTLPDETPVTVAKIGEFYAAYNQSSTPTVNQKVYASTTDGSILTATTGQTISGYLETTFVVKVVLEEDALVMISNWNPASA